MLLSIGIILITGLLAGWAFGKIKFPPLFGMILAGIIIGPYAFNILDEKILGISAELRKIALIIILLRAGLTLNVNDLKRVGRPAVLMCFLPACAEMLGMVILAPILLHVSLIDAAVMGAVVAAVSPAVVVPRMINLIEEKYGTGKGIPQMILAGASADDVFVIVMFGVFTGIAKGEGASVMRIICVPVSIILGIAVGFVVGKVLCFFFGDVHMRDTVKVIVMMSVSLIFCAFEDSFEYIPFSSLIAVMFIGIAINLFIKEVSVRISDKLNKLWVCAEIFLFVLVGASVNIKSAKEIGFSAVILIFAVLIFRMAGVLLCLIGTDLNFAERMFCVISYIPKATVQAAIGGLPLAMGLSCGSAVLTVSVAAILITAPLGAFGIDFSYKKLLYRESSGDRAKKPKIGARG